MFKKFVVIFSVIEFSLKSYGFLVVPPTSPTRHQLVLGLGVPLNLEHEAITYGWTVKAQYFLPESTADQLKWPYFSDVWLNYDGFPPKTKTKTALNTVSQYVETAWKPFPYGGKRRRRREVLVDEKTGQKYEKYDGVVEEVGNEELKNNATIEDEEIFDDEINNIGMIPKLSDYPFKTEEELMDSSGTRWLLYDGFGRMLSQRGLEGRYCVLRAICEAAEFNFGYHNGLFGQLFHIVFTPSTTDDPIVNKDHYDYVKAEMLGQAGEPCAKIFYQCNRSVLDIFTKIYDFTPLSFG